MPTDKGVIVELLRELTAKHGQDHIWQHWPRLNEAEREQFLSDLSRVDFEQLDMLIARYINNPPAKFSGEMEPIETIPVPESEAARRREEQARAAGEEVLRAGKVAALVVAGGQGSRLGFPGPKGSYPISPIRDKSLFQLHAERVLAASRRYGRRIPCCIMTSEATDAPTREFFHEHEFFGMPPEDVIFFVQGMVPSVDRDGKLLLAEGGHIAMNPDGHGGTYAALHKSGTLAELEKRGVEIISYFQVDNALVKPVDPVFIGHHALRNAEMSSKALRKRDWSEKLGVFGRMAGRNMVIEYMNIDEKTLKLTNPDGALKYWAGSIAIHLLNVDFVRRINESDIELPVHRSEKAIPHVDGSGVLVDPDEPNGVKFETFLFDALPHAREIVTMEVRREEEFSPVKNSDDAGVDCPATTRRDLQRLWAGWLARCGVCVPVDADGVPTVRAEISPLTALDAAELRDGLPDGFAVCGDVDI